MYRFITASLNYFGFNRKSGVNRNTFTPEQRLRMLSSAPPNIINGGLWRVAGKNKINIS